MSQDSRFKPLIPLLFHLPYFSCPIFSLFFLFPFFLFPSFLRRLFSLSLFPPFLPILLSYLSSLPLLAPAFSFSSFFPSILSLLPVFSSSFLFSIFTLFERLLLFSLSHLTKESKISNIALHCIALNKNCIVMHYATHGSFTMDKVMVGLPPHPSLYFCILFFPSFPLLSFILFLSWLASDFILPPMKPAWNRRCGNAAMMRRRTVGQNRESHRINSHPIIHFPTSEGVSEVSERSGGREQSEQSIASK